MTGLTPLQTAHSIAELGEHLKHFLSTDKVDSEDARRAELLSLCNRAAARVSQMRSSILAGGGFEDSSSAVGPAPSPAENTCPLCHRPQDDCDAAVAERLARPVGRTLLATVRTRGSVAVGPLVPRQEAA